MVKDSAVPTEWDLWPIYQLTRNIIDYRGRTPRKLGMEWGGGDIPALSAKNVKMGYVDLAEDTYFGSDALYKRWMQAGDPRKDDILVTMEAPLGNIALLPDDRKYILSQRTVLLQTHPDVVCNGFLVQLMMSQTFQNMLRKNATGSTATGIQRKKFEKLEVALPPFPEQRAIATALSDVDALITSLDRIIAKKRDIKQAAMQQLLTGKTRLPGFSGAWEMKRLGEILDYEQPAKYLVENTEYTDNGIPVLTAGKTFILGYTTEQEGICTNLPVIVFDDFTTASRYVDFPFKVKSSAIKLLRARNGDVDLRFVFEKLQTLQFALGDHKRYYISEYQHIRIDVPSPTEQRAIATVLSDMDAEISALERRRDKTRALKQGMMQELLTGKTRLL